LAFKGLIIMHLLFVINNPHSDFFLRRHYQSHSHEQPTTVGCLCLSQGHVPAFSDRLTESTRNFDKKSRSDEGDSKRNTPEFKNSLHILENSCPYRLSNPNSSDVQSVAWSLYLLSCPGSHTNLRYQKEQSKVG